MARLTLHDLLDLDDQFLVDRPVAPPPKQPRHPRFPFCCRRRRPQHCCAAVLADDVLTAQILSCASIGSLQMLSMTNKAWLERAYRLASEVDIDMGSWPFAVTELRKHRLGRFLFCDWDWNGMASGQTWKSTELKDSRVGDADLQAALRRFQPSQLARLVASSSSLSSSSVRWALESFSGLRELCLSTCGSGKLGAEVQASLEICTSLRSFHLDRVQLRPPASARGLSELIVGRQVMQDLWPLGHFQQLRVLNVSNEAFVDPAFSLRYGLDAILAELRSPSQNEQVYRWLLETFKQCCNLQEIQLYLVVQVTNEMLAVLMEHVPDLKQFRGCHTSPLHTIRSIDFPFVDATRPLNAGGLSTEATAAFEALFPAANLFIDNVYEELMLADSDWSGEFDKFVLGKDVQVDLSGRTSKVGRILRGEDISNLQEEESEFAFFKGSAEELKKLREEEEKQGMDPLANLGIKKSKKFLGTVRNDRRRRVDAEEGLGTHLPTEGNFVFGGFFPPALPRWDGGDAARDFVGSVNLAMANASEIRQGEKLANAGTIAEAQKAQAAVVEAISVLKEFYEKSGLGAALLQEGSKEPDFDTAYGGQDAGGVVQLLQQISADFARLEADTKAEEQSATEEFEKLSKDYKLNKAEKETDLKHLQQSKVEKTSQLATKGGELQSGQQELAAALQYYEELKPPCVKGGKAWQEREKQREEELKSLKEAVEIMSNATK
ncbi:Uncharacterized protein SCF082_LOCUS35232 [Durusdinium trenchii]|uniref:Uncharacterized protein n=1 Tax=Durusdinium trenchii TaxID=1381693 RepID=A0ABP0P836_9DINO